MRSIKALLFAGAACAVSTPALADEISPWTPVGGGVEAEIAWTRQSADSLNAGEAVAPLPRDLNQTTVSLDITYGVTDKLAIDIHGGYAKSEFLVDPGLAPDGGLEDITDITIGARYKLLDEVDGAPLTATVGIAAIIDGGYRTGSLPAIGDGGTGGQAAFALGKAIGPFAISANVGYRTRDNNVPDEVFGGARASVAFADRFSVYGGLSFVNSTSGIDIGGPGFTPARFPEVEEDYKLWLVGGAFAVTNRFSINATYGEKFDGRNTARSEVIRVGLGYAY
ncbi:hypothetical protein IM511_06045 [Erythrobacteraceae bacterium E2-1 Yellow Sea]|nr:hypothetical protein [Erythrobacteraceae bacterium E2-1 Yellow Sea]